MSNLIKSFINVLWHGIEKVYNLLFQLYTICSDYLQQLYLSNRKNF